MRLHLFWGSFYNDEEYACAIVQVCKNEELPVLPQMAKATEALTCRKHKSAFITKGEMTVKGALKAVATGAYGVMVSNEISRGRAMGSPFEE